MNDKRDLHALPIDPAYLEGLMGRVRIEPYAKHKHAPQEWGLNPVGGFQEDATFCDRHAGFHFEDRRRIPRLVRRGLRVGLVGPRRDGRDPRMIWTIDDTGWVYEARVTNAQAGIFHAYPLMRGEAIARKVIDRSSTHRGMLSITRCAEALRLARERYL